MIDTVILVIPQSGFEILNYDAFNPSARCLYEAPFKGKMRCFQNPAKGELANGIYNPKLTVIKYPNYGGIETSLIVEFSAPKLLFGNNFEELENGDFEKIVDILQAKLKEMQVRVDKDSINNAGITAIHYGKNFVLEDAPSSLVISAVEKMNISKRLDINKANFKNGGQAIRFHAKSYELTFYDKVKELEQSKISDQRVMENDNEIQIDLLEVLLNKEILRMEVRLNKPKKIKQVLKACSIEKEKLTFKELFNKRISGFILNHFWDKYIKSSMNAVLTDSDSSIELINKIKESPCRDNRLLQVFGAIKIINDEGYCTLKKIVPSHTFYRLKKDIDQIKADKSSLLSAFASVECDLAFMDSLKLEHLCRGN